MYGVGGIGLVLWLLLASGLATGLRLAGGGGLLGTIAVFALGVELRGMTMDGVPLIAWRGTPEAGAQLPGGRLDIWSGQRSRSSRWPEQSADLQQPRRHWRQEVGAGFAGFALAGGEAATVAITQEQRRSYECIVAYDLRTGSEIWVYADSARFATLRAGVGPRSTPVVDGGLVYALGASGWLRCLAGGDGGRLVWRRRIGARAATWGLWASPVIVDDLVIVAGAPGQQGVPLSAFDRRSGEPRWQVEAGGGVPILATVAGVRQLILSGVDGASGHLTPTGMTLWRTSWPESDGVLPAFEHLQDGSLLFGGGRGGVRVIDVQAHVGAGGMIVALLWRALHLRPTLSAVVQVDGFLYGLDDGRLVCLDATTGFRRWQGARYGHGRLRRAGRHLLVQSEDGDIAVVACDSAQFRQLLRFQAVDTRRGWALPTVHLPWVLTRGTGEAALWELPELDDL